MPQNVWNNLTGKGFCHPFIKLMSLTLHMGVRKHKRHFDKYIQTKRELQKAKGSLCLSNKFCYIILEALFTLY